MSSISPLRELRRGVIVIHPFGPYHEAQFLEDPVEIEQLIADGESWRVTDAVLLAAEP
jgi:hypothetical protein